ncbi:hypothetical protein [Streptomyces sp. ST2-7A]|uniref:hypothetical protein n=1 Tax=Streptomyces sp. ST2-7A TaxID=2907214 RepID=UPI001F481A35|nr:hypothetical protein [Streptomyces sp. ST2-7A]MCE7078837.1 hypothetical protein [Streptomyces sp. ST2-7A]
MSDSDGNAILVNVLTSSLRSTLNGMETAPGLLRQVLEEGSWRTFTTPRGETVTYETFEQFVTTAPTKGLGRTVEELVQVVSDDETTLALLAKELGFSVEELRNTEGLQNILNPITEDAQAFGSYAKVGGWMFGLLVARNVTPENAKTKTNKGDVIPGSGKPNETLERFKKVSARQFALMADTSAARVTRFYRAWERAAESGLVPSARELHPGQSIELPDADLWANYFSNYEKSTERRENIAQQAEIAGTSYNLAVKVAENPSALRTAILGDVKTAENAREALFARMEKDDELRVSLVRSVASDPQIKKHLTSEARKHERSQFIRNIAEEGRAKSPTGQTVELPENFKARISDQLAVVEDSEADAEAVSVAYEAVRDLITEAIESDPEMQALEHRSRVTKALTATAKSIQSIDPEVLANFADDSVRTTVTELQRKINELADLLGESKTVTLRAV